MFPCNQQSAISDCALQPRLNLAGQGAEVGHALQFVVRQFDVKMIFQFREQIERLQAVDPKRLEEIVVGRELFARNFEVRRGQSEDLVEVFSAVSIRVYSNSVSLRQIGLGVRAFDEFLQSGLHRGPRKQLAENIDFLSAVRRTESV